MNLLRSLLYPKQEFAICINPPPMNTVSVLNTKPSFENYLKVIELKIVRLVLKKTGLLNIVNFWGFQFITRS